MIRAVLDSNVLVSALISGQGSPAAIIACWQAEVFEIIISSATMQELDRVLHYDRLRKNYPLPEDDVQRFLHLFRTQALQVFPLATLAVIERDPTDNRYLECALAGEAQYIVSGDKHLLELKEYRSIQILTPAEFIMLLGTLKA
jgi:putative PIN family toxin of toxin-antitoxin system